MKRVLYILVVIALAASCNREVDYAPSSNPAPVIYTESWAQSMVANVGSVFHLNPSFSPVRDSKCTWYLDEQVLSTERELFWTPEAEGTFVLTFEVVNGTRKAIRTTLVTVGPEIVEPGPGVDPDPGKDPEPEPEPEPEPDPEQEDPDENFVPGPFTPKTGIHTVFGFFDADGDLSTIPWGSITHLIVTTSNVNANARVSYPLSDAQVRELVNTAHANGVYVIMQFSGSHNNVTSVQKYACTDFYGPATNTALADKLSSRIMTYALRNGLDGVHIWMDKPTSSDDGYSDLTSLVGFYNSLGMKRPEKSLAGDKFTLSIGIIPSQYQTKGCQDAIATLSCWDYVFSMVMCIEALSNTSHASQEIIKPELSYWQAKGVKKDKLIVTIPAVVWCVDASSVGGISGLTYGNISSCSTYKYFSDLATLTGDTAAVFTQKNNYTNVSGYNWIRYDGFPWVKTKLGYLTDPGAGGVALWKLNFDGHGADDSMLGFIKQTLGY